jgi:hypothetical protein
MRHAFFSLFAAAAILGAAFAQEAKADCFADSFDAECRGSYIDLTWLIDCSQDCTATVDRIDRKCGASGWVTIVDNPTGGSYSDLPPMGCLSGYVYRLVLDINCGGTHTSKNYDAGPISCP